MVFLKRGASVVCLRR